MMTEEQKEKQEEVGDVIPTQLQKSGIDNSVAKVDDAVINHSLSRINFFDANQLAAAEAFLTKIMRSKKGGIESVNDGLAILMRAQDLNLPFSTCIEHIHVINNKTGIDIHIVKALLLKAGVTWECTKDYTPLYEYTDGFNVYVDGSFPDYVVKCKNLAEATEKNKQDENSDIVYVYPVKWYQDFNGNIYKDYQLNTKQFAIVVNRAQAMEVAKSGKVAVYRIPNKPVDYITEYCFTRKMNGKVFNSVGHFSYSEAAQADMFEKDTYKKYPRILIGHRAFTLGARDIASDVLFGVMETTELKIVTGKELVNNDIQDVEAIEI